MKHLPVSCLFLLFWSLMAVAQDGSQLKRQIPNNSCDNVSWTSWNSFSRREARGALKFQNNNLTVLVRSDVNFESADQVWHYEKFTRFRSPMPNATIPSISGADRPSTLSICFSQPVKDGLLMVGSLGSVRLQKAMTLKFSSPYAVVYDAGGMQFHNNKSVTGIEGYAILRFTGEIRCLSITFSSSEKYTNLTWGIPDCPPKVMPAPPKPVIAKPPLRKAPSKPIIATPKRVAIAAIQKPVIAAQPPVPDLPAKAESPVPPKASKLLKIQIWDADGLDRDSIRIKFNGRQIGADAIPIRLYKRDCPESTYQLDAQLNENTLEISTVTEGLKPGVTIGLLIMYSDTRKKVFYTLKAKETVKIPL